MNKDDKKPNIPPNFNLLELVKRAEEVYQNLKDKIEPTMDGKFIAVEVESGDYFIGETREEAVTKSQEKYPTRIPLVRKIGELEKTSRHLSAPRRKYVVC